MYFYNARNKHNNLRIYNRHPIFFKYVILSLLAFAKNEKIVTSDTERWKEKFLKI